MPGTLFVVATPIGNLEDLSFRALRTLREVNLIAAEDTRRTGKLLAHYEIRTPMVSLHEHNEFREAPRLVARLERGENVALVSDAGTPGLSDPGAILVRLTRAAGLTPIPIPGPSALAAALSVAGLKGTEFVFMGFPPPKGTDRARWFDRLKSERRAVVFYESPHRVRATISECASILAERQIDIVREISKINYELVRWPINNPALSLKELGEFAIVIHEQGETEVSDDGAADMFTLFGLMIDKCDLTERSAELAVSAVFGIDSEAVRSALRLGRKLAKQQKMTAR